MSLQSQYITPVTIYHSSDNISLQRQYVTSVTICHLCLMSLKLIRLRDFQHDTSHWYSSHFCSFKTSGLNFNTGSRRTTQTHRRYISKVNFSNDIESICTKSRPSGSTVSIKNDSVHSWVFVSLPLVYTSRTLVFVSLAWGGCPSLVAGCPESMTIV